MKLNLTSTPGRRAAWAHSWCPPEGLDVTVCLGPERDAVRVVLAAGSVTSPAVVQLRAEITSRAMTHAILDFAARHMAASPALGHQLDAAWSLFQSQLPRRRRPVDCGCEDYPMP